MNERIKELVKQAGGHFSTRNLMSNPVQHRESIELWDKNIEKFAELIVKEVFDCIANEGFEVYGPVTQKVKKHFGVEE
jgi:hypothetical protein